MVTRGKLFVLLAAVLVCAGIVSASESFKVSAIAQYDDALMFSVVNNYRDDISNARIKAVIPELGIIFPAKAVDLKEDVDISMFMISEDEFPEGEYLVRISIKKKKKRKIVHRYVYFD